MIEGRVRIFTINAVVDGKAAEVARRNTACLALAELRDAQTKYARAWVCDETGADLNAAELIRLVAEERGGSR